MDDDLPAALADLVLSYRDELTALCATRTAQTNEARRAAVLRPGFGRAAASADGRPLALVKLGTSAGLLLLSDRYGCRYVGEDGRTAAYGTRGVPESLTVEILARTGPTASGWSGPPSSTTTARALSTPEA